MDTWAAVSAVAVLAFFLTYGLERLTRHRERMEGIRKRLEGRREDVLEAMTEMNKILLQGMVIRLPGLLAFLWALSLGTIETPLGPMGALWWYVLSYMVVAGGVGLGSALQKAAKASGSKDAGR